MQTKIIGWVSWGVGAVSLLSWTSASVGQKIEYGSRMKRYLEWREEFFRKDLQDKTYLMCNSSSKEECWKEDQSSQYLPKPNEDDLWEFLYESLQKNNESQKEEHLKQLTYIQDSFQLKDYCYGEVKKAISEAQKGNNQYFNLNSSTGSKGGKDISHDRCTLSEEELKTYIKK